ARAASQRRNDIERPFTRRSNQLYPLVVEAELRGKQGTEGIVTSGARMESMEEQLRLSIEPWRNRCMSGRGPAPRRLQQRLVLLAVRAEHMIGNRDSNAICRGAE